ncbi:MAG TPA: hypothetical protein VFV34_02435 [Blastocatellia bacterium]|nr:hypothetical protein [Blastocatellia bacterium]
MKSKLASLSSAFAICVLSVATANAQIATLKAHLQDGQSGTHNDSISPTDDKPQSQSLRTGAGSRDLANSRLSFDLSGIDTNIIKEFKRAWTSSEAGASNFEGLVLIYPKPGGSYLAVSQGCYDDRRCVFTWRPNIIAIVHTHRNKDDRRPSPQDERVANRFGVPIFTITSRGMYLYDPETRRTTQIMDGLDWLNPSSWEKKSATALIR